VDPRTFTAVRSAVEILCAVRDIAPHQISIKEPASLDRDWGTTSLRLGLTAGKSADTIMGEWRPRLEEFEDLRSRYLLY
jgi:uncharacterized protein YbbC (DUF1343 family)